MQPRKTEWALVAAAISAALNWSVGFRWDGLSAEQASLWMAGINAVAALFVAWRTRPVLPGVYVYVISALAALGAAYGMDWSQESVALFTSAMIAVLAMLHRVQVSPAEDVDPRVLGKPPTPVRT